MSNYVFNSKSHQYWHSGRPRFLIQLSPLSVLWSQWPAIPRWLSSRHSAAHPRHHKFKNMTARILTGGVHQQTANWKNLIILPLMMPINMDLLFVPSKIRAVKICWKKTSRLIQNSSTEQKMDWWPDAHVAIVLSKLDYLIRYCINWCYITN